MAQPPKRPTTRRTDSTTTPRRAASRKAASTPETVTSAPKTADTAPTKPKRGRPPKAAQTAATVPTSLPAPAAAKPATTRTPKAPARRTRSAAKPAPAVAKKRHDQAEHQARDSHGRFKVSHRARTVVLGVTGVVAAGLGIGAAFARGWLKLPKGKAAKTDKPQPTTDAPVLTTLEEDARRPLDKG